MSISSLDPNYLKAVEDICSELLKVGLPKKYAAIVASATKQPAVAEGVKPAKFRFPKDNDVVQQFSIQGLWQTVQQAMASDNVVLTAGQSAAVQLQLAALLELRRHYGRKKLPRMQQIVRAAHRRAIVTGSEGSVRHDLVRRITRTLLSS
jgi:hypothetical protein